MVVVIGRRERKEVKSEGGRRKEERTNSKVLHPIWISGSEAEAGNFFGLILHDGSRILRDYSVNLSCSSSLEVFSAAFQSAWSLVEGAKV